MVGEKKDGNLHAKSLISYPHNVSRGGGAAAAGGINRDTAQYTLSTVAINGMYAG